MPSQQPRRPVLPRALRVRVLELMGAVTQQAGATVPRHRGYAVQHYIGEDRGQSCYIDKYIQKERLLENEYTSNTHDEAALVAEARVCQRVVDRRVVAAQIVEREGTVQRTRPVPAHGTVHARPHAIPWTRESARGGQLRTKRVFLKKYFHVFQYE